MDEEISVLRNQSENSESISTDDKFPEREHKDHDDQLTDECTSTSPSVGDNISVYCPLHDTFYNGVVHSETPDRNVTVSYDDSDVETLDLTEET